MSGLEHYQAKLKEMSATDPEFKDTQDLVADVEKDLRECIKKKFDHLKDEINQIQGLLGTIVEQLEHHNEQLVEHDEAIDKLNQESKNQKNINKENDAKHSKQETRNADQAQATKTIKKRHEALAEMVKSNKADQTQALKAITKSQEALKKKVEDLNVENQIAEIEKQHRVVCATQHGTYIRCSF